MLGSYDWLSSYGLTKQAGVQVHNPFAGDQITQMIPWTNLAWTQVHHAQLPLWNPYSALGMPLAFNWQSAAFSVPAMVGYLVPLRLNYTAQIVMTLWVAGTGAYFFSRVLGLGRVASAWAGTVFELCGMLVFWLGWPIASVMSWSGWLFGAIVLVVRGGRRVRAVALLGVVLACAVYAGQPDALIVLLLAAVIFSMTILAVPAVRCRSVRPTVRPIVDLGFGWLAGLCLAAPLLLPGLQLVSGSVRSANGEGLFSSQSAQSATVLVQTAFPDLVGNPFVSAYVYIGLLTFVFMVVAWRFRWRRPVVVGLTVVGLVVTGLAFSNPVITVANSLPGVHAVRFPRAIVLLGFVLAVLSAYGVDMLSSFERRAEVFRVVQRVFIGAGCLIVFAVLVNGGRTSDHVSVLRAPAEVGTMLSVVIGYAAVKVVSGRLHRAETTEAEAQQNPGRLTPEMFRRHAIGLGVALLLLETIFLVANGDGLQASNTTGFPSNRLTRQLQVLAGGAIVGFGSPNCANPPALGIRINANVAYGVHELGVYDPMTPRAYYSSWFEHTARVGGIASISHFCPAIESAAEARLYGVRYVLEEPGAPGPTGGKFVENIGNEQVFDIPGSSVATVSPIAVGGRLPPDSAAGQPVPVAHPSPSSWTMTTDESSAQVLRLRLTDVPGWTARIDGHPLALQAFAGIMLQARITPGRHVVELSYWPPRFSMGIGLFVTAAFGLLVAAVLALRVKTRREPRNGVAAASTG
jgi:hypothetical protein